MESFRFTATDDLGQRQEGLLIRRDDLVYSIDLFVPEGAPPIDLGSLAVGLLTAYDQGTP